MSVKPLAERPLDMLYFCFFLIHVPATLLLDLQALYPAELLPRIITQLPVLYVTMSSDPLIGGAMGYSGDPSTFVWFKSFLMLEAFFQLPVFLLGMRGLMKGSRSIYLLLLIYGASTATTTLPCLAVVLATPTTSSETVAAGIASVTASQRFQLLASYVPFFLIPLFMALDMAYRVSSLLTEGQKAAVAAKSR